MNKKWGFLFLIIILYFFGIIGVSWQTYDKFIALEVEPTIEVVKIIFIMLGGLGVILPTYLNIWQSLETNNLVKDDINRKRIENTFNLLEKWDNPALLEARKTTRELKDKQNDLSANDILKLINTNPDLKMSVILVLNYFDLVRISIEHNRVDAKIVKECLGRVILEILTRLEPYIQTLPDRKDLDKLFKLIKEVN